MRVLAVHNYYQNSGGEDSVYSDELTLLRNHGHDVLTLCLHNERIKTMWKYQVALGTIWSYSGANTTKRMILAEKPDIVHFHNFFPLISPSAHWAAHKIGIPIVQTFHNFRILCSNALLLRDGLICEKCVGCRFGWHAVRHRCYRKSFLGSAVVAGMNSFHQNKSTWSITLDASICLTDFGRAKLLTGGIASDTAYVKPNFVFPDPGIGDGNGGYAIFVGRLSPEKGLRVVVEAWKKLGPSHIPLYIIGAGSDLPDTLPINVKHMGWKSRAEVISLMQQASLFVIPSQWYEGFPKVIVESLAVGTPVIASNLGAMAEIVIPGVNGYHFRTGDAQDLADTIRSVLSDPIRLEKLRETTRTDYEHKYTAEINYQIMMDIYSKAIAHRKARKDS